MYQDKWSREEPPSYNAPIGWQSKPSKTQPSLVQHVSATLGECENGCLLNDGEWYVKRNTFCMKHSLAEYDCSKDPFKCCCIGRYQPAKKFDENSFKFVIRSEHGGYVLTAQSDISIKMMKFTGAPDQFWKYDKDDNRLEMTINGRTRYLSVIYGEQNYLYMAAYTSGVFSQNQQCSK